MPEIPSCLFWEPPAGFLVNGPFSLPPFSLPRRSRGPVVNYGIEVCQELFHCPAISLIFTLEVTPQVSRGVPAAPPVPGRPGGSTGRRPLRPLPPPGGGLPMRNFRSVTHLITVTPVAEDLSMHPTPPSACFPGPASREAEYPTAVPYHRDHPRHGQKGTIESPLWTEPG